MNTTTELFAFAYGRVSSQVGTGSNHGSRQEASIEIQNQMVRDYLDSIRIPPAAFGVDFERVFLERHTGAFDFGNLRTRPLGAQLWAALEAARRAHPAAAIHLIFTKVDRFSRHWLEGQLMMRDLRDLRIKLHIIQLGGQGFDCETDIGQKMLSDMLWFAEMEVKMIKARILENKATTRAAGLHLGGNHPYGWDLQATGKVSGKDKPLYLLIDNPEEQKWLRYMAQRLAAGQSYHYIAKELNALGVPAKRGGKWQCGNVMKVLTNATVTAWLECGTRKAA